jgi:DNA-binding transcriptional LysR family regulator
MNITLRQLDIFCKIAQSGNVSQAAQAACVSQSAASMALAELERQLDEKLFDRYGKKIVLNDSGRQLLADAQELLIRADEIERRFGPEKGTLHGGFTVGASSTVGNYLMPALIGQFSQHYSGVQLQLTVGNTEQIIASLLNCEIDIGIIEGICREPKITSTVWRSDELVLFASPLHPLAGKTHITREKLAEAQWILREKGSGTREVFERAICGVLDALDVRFELGHTEAVKQAVLHNLGISCLSRLTLQENLKNKQLVELKVSFLELTRNFYLLVRKGKYETRALKAFIEFLRQDSLSAGGL